MAFSLIPETGAPTIQADINAGLSHRSSSSHELNGGLCLCGVTFLGMNLQL